MHVTPRNLIFAVFAGTLLALTVARAQTTGPALQKYDLTVPIDATGLPPEVRNVGAICRLMTGVGSGRSVSEAHGPATGSEVRVVSGEAHGEVRISLQATSGGAGAYQCSIAFFVVTPTYTGYVNEGLVPRATVPVSGTARVEGALPTR